MATATTSPATPRTRRRPARRPGDPARKRLAGAVLMVIFGSFMPWIDTAAGTVSGARGAGLWTFYAAMLGLAGALVPLKRLAVAQATIMALVCLAFPVWQVVHMLNLVGTGGWMPGPGLVLVFAGGVLAGSSAWRLSR